MNNKQYFDLVARVVFEVCRYDVTSADLRTPLAEIEIDSVELMEVFGVLEEELGICLRDDEIAEVSTFEELLFLLSAHQTPQMSVQM